MPNNITDINKYRELRKVKTSKKKDNDIYFVWQCNCGSYLYELLKNSVKCSGCNLETDYSELFDQFNKD